MANKTLEKKVVKKALIVEDEADMCLLLNLMIDSTVMECDHVKSIAKAKEFLQTEPIDVVLLDNKLPDGYGVDFITFLKQNYPNIKIIMISGYDASAEDVALENGADLFLQKPFTKDQLFQSIMKFAN